MLFLFPSTAKAQNPSFGGKEFRKIWTGGTIPQGASVSPSITETYLTPAGVYLQSRVSGIGMYFIDDSGAYTIATKDQPEFSGTQYFTVIGSKPEGSMIICPVAINNPYPCQLYSGSGLTAISAPTPEQAINLSNYFDGRMVYLTISNPEGARIWYYSEGNPVELLLDNTAVTNLSTILDYDGESLAFAAGTTGDFDIWLRESNGTLARIIGNGDALPGVDGDTYTGTPGYETVEIDEGKVYVHGVGSGFPAPQSLFSSSDGATFDVIAATGQEVPGLTGVTIVSMSLKQVRNGKIWLLVTQSDNDKVLYQIINNVWTRVAGQSDTFNGIVYTGFDAFEHGMLGDSVVIAVSYFNFSTFKNVVELYVNADLPGFGTTVAGTVLEIAPSSGSSWTISAVGEAGKTNTLQTSSSLTNTTWDTVGSPVVADGSGLSEWTVSFTNAAQYFRLTEE